MNAGKLQAGLAAKQSHLCRAETSRTSQDGHTHTHPHTHTELSPWGGVIKAFMGVVIEE